MTRPLSMYGLKESMMAINEKKEPSSWITEMVRDWVNTSPENTLENAAHEKAWDDPLVGFSRGDDAYWESFKEHVGPFHWTPEEAFEKSFLGSHVPPHKLTVISWVLPQMQKTKLDTRKEKTYPPESWARARFYGEMVNEKLRRHVVLELAKADIRATAPMLHPEWSRMPSDKFVFSSKWSERHAAFVSGLGTFGLCDGLITARGKAMRVGSVVAEIEVPPTARPYRHHREYCLWFSRGTCKKCVQRCPVGALSEKGHDKISCMKYTHGTCKRYIKEHYGFDFHACGFCQTGVPCESRIPVKEGDE
jgi:epoxyqueuosine reductase